MTELSEMDSQLSELVNVKQNWVDQGCPKDLADNLKRRMDHLPRSLEIHDLFLNNLRAEMDVEQFQRIGRRDLTQAPAQPVTPGEGGHESSLDQMILDAFAGERIGMSDNKLPAPVPGRNNRVLPVRNQGLPQEGHVDLFDTHNGLVHGGIIHKNHYRLTCRAFRFFTYTSSRLFKKPGSHEHLVSVAGVCEQTDDRGRIIQKWSTAIRLPQYYTSATQALPDPPVAPLPQNGAGIRLHGFYFSSIPGSTKLTFEDTGWPFDQVYNPYSAENIYARPPDHRTAVENALFDRQPAPSEATPICTPYIKVTAPHPDMDETIVQMAGIYRHMTRHWPPSRTNFSRGGRYYVKTFSSKGIQGM